ncbi:hypothetical protein ACFOU2_21055 [Bacillus songklensis]|uniref:Uncharacterized protein n=1 Tax=Bacillus songklensis TaxID=1069116 RepID=A0ABV8B9J3_9BACI
MTKKQQIPDHQMNFTGTVSQALGGNVDTSGTPKNISNAEKTENALPTNEAALSSNKEDSSTF